MLMVDCCGSLHLQDSDIGFHNNGSMLQSHGMNDDTSDSTNDGSIDISGDW